MAEKTEKVTMTLDELEKLVDSRVQKALKQSGVRHAKSPAPRVKVNHGRFATSAGYIDTRPDSFWKDKAKALKTASDTDRAGLLEMLVAHRRSIVNEMDPGAQKVDAFIAENFPEYTPDN